jgi:hypothetical protein
MVASDPAPPAMYPNGPGSSRSAAARSQSSGSIGQSALPAR